MNASDQAAEWFIAQRTGELTPEERERFMRWLGDSAANVREYLAIAELWGTLPSVPGVAAADLHSLNQALGTRASVTELGSSAAQSNAREAAFVVQGASRSKRSRLLSIAAAASALLIVGIAAWLATQQSRATELITGRGEQRSLELPDGSVLQLNAVSHVVVAFDDHHRNVELRKGEALFHVSKDATRPFEVIAPGARVRVLGTTFNVYHRGTDTRVAVVEGKVQVQSESQSGSAPVALAANEMARVASGGRIVGSTAETRKVTAWTQRRLIFDEETLGEVVAQFNLYNVHQLSVGDTELAQLRINGVFDADDPAALVAYLERLQGVAAENDKNGIRLRRSTTH